MLNIIYRLCENEADGNLRDIRPSWFNKFNCLNSFLESADWAKDKVGKIVFVHDGPEGKLLDTIPSKYEIVKIYDKDNLSSLLKTFDVANEIGGDIYFVEDDYLHTLSSIEKIAKALPRFGLVNGYDHPDRYFRTDDDYYELKICFDRESDTHWRTSESTCCTFAVKEDIYKLIEYDLRRFGLNDRGLFRHLHNKAIPLWTAIPGITSQIDLHMSPGINWEFINECYDYSILSENS